jgi:hypothetical protein
VTDPEPIDFDFGGGSKNEQAPDAPTSTDATAGDATAGDATAGDATADSAARASAAGAAFAVTSYPYAPAAIERAKPAWTHGATPQPWSRERRLTMGILLAVLAVVAAAVIALSIRAIDVFLRGG